MGSTPPTALATIPSAFAAACRLSRTDGELLERCRMALVQRFQSDRIWLLLLSGHGETGSVGPPDRGADGGEVTRLKNGDTEVVILADKPAAAEMRGVATSLAVGLSVVFELRSILLERQGALDDAVFQLRALRQVARLLSSVHSTEETEQLILDFMAEVFFAWWATLYRATGPQYIPKLSRSLADREPPPPIERDSLDQALPAGSAAAGAEDVAVATLVGDGAQLIVPLDAGAERMAVLVLGGRISEKPYGRAELELAGTLSFAAAIALKNAELVEQLHSAATTDELTGLYNRRALEERLAAEISRSLRHQLHTSVLLLDLDRFKVINDTMGHAAGDRLLVLVANVLRQQARALDVVGRLGGDEFLVVLPMTKPTEAQVFVGRVQASLDQLAAAHPEFGQCTLSIGVAEAPRHGSTVGALLAAADTALYRAKRGGRNTVEVADE
ncbi:MAG TPA: sensor domain-containing diguanylate cyclase [Gemmatimonadales bacterium]|jgi:diguanylate cyclase (GGDEF)-like protein|nr:sensor domain-containing diguanylate cyclase [Gemmatimonadales bacterium]